jgi:hypothetical protein
MRAVGKLVLKLCLAATLATMEAGASSGTFAFPVDLEWLARSLDKVCTARAPELKPTMLERFNAWKSRLGTYYGPYQQWLYDSAVESFPESDRKEQLAKLRLRYEALYVEQFEALELAGASEVASTCVEMSKSWSNPELDATIRMMVDAKASAKEPRK